MVNQMAFAPFVATFLCVHCYGDSIVRANTLRTIIRRDSSVRYDHALRLANTLGIDIPLICKENPYDVGEVEPGLLNDYHGFIYGDKSEFICKKANACIA